MAAKMFDFKGLRNSLINEISAEFEWDESSESDSEIFTEVQDYHSITFHEDKTFERNFTLEESSNSNEADYYVGKDGVNKWYNVPFKVHNFQESEILPQLNSSEEITYEAKTFIECLFLFIDNQILELIVSYTNLFITKIQPRFHQPRDCKITSMDEMKCFIGVLILIGLFKSKNENFSELWEQNGLGIEVFKLSMSLNRFKFLLRTIQFDDENSRELRKHVDNLAIIREIFDLFNYNCHKNNLGGDDLTIGEFFIDYKGQCPTYLHAKEEPRVSGIKMLIFIDTHNFYISNMMIHVKNQPDGPYEQSNNPRDIVHKLITNSQRYIQNIILTTDLSCVSLIKKLSNQNTTVTGSLHETEDLIPLEFVSNSHEHSNSFIYGFQENMTLMSCSINENKNTILLNTGHYATNIDAKAIISSIAKSYKNATVSVNKIINMIHEYSVARRTRRYSLSIWFCMIDIACSNSFITYCINNKVKISKREFLKKLGLTLINNAVKSRANDRYQTKELRKSAAEFSSTLSLNPKAYDEVKNKPMRCSVCSRKHDIKVRSFCYQCKLPMCKKHMFSICEKCFN